MKKNIFIVFLLCTLLGYSQEKTTSQIENNLPKNTELERKSATIGKWSTVSSDSKRVGRTATVSNYATVSLSSGISLPSSNFSDDSYASNGFFIDFSGAYYFSNFGMGLSVGYFSNPTSKNFDKFTNSIDFTTENNSENWKTTYYGFGPQYKYAFNKFEVSLLTRIGIMSIKQINLQSNFNQNVDISFPVYSLTTNDTSSLSYFSTAIKIGYNFTENFNLFFAIDYLSALSKELTITESTIHDVNNNGIIDAEDLKSTNNGADLSYDITSKNSKPQTTNFGIGVSYNFGNSSTRKRPGRVKYSDVTLERNPIHESGTTVGENPIYTGENRGSVILTNPTKENIEQKNKQQKLINVLPKNNSSFKSASEIKNFSWKLIGNKIANPHYIIEVVKISSSKQIQRTYISKTTKTTINPTVIFKENKLSDGQYSWKITETTTGISSNHSYFTLTNCEINYSISNDTIECLGYVGADRKFKICFDTTYSSASGDLTFANLGSGLSIYDQSYTPLTYTLVGSNPTLVTQIGATTSTVSYCFEVTVPSSVTSIGFGLQGDDLDPSPIECKPGVSQLFDELPSCLCDDCDQLEVSFDNFNTSLNGATGNQFNFNGNINVNVPIYGLEFQIQSYSYTANPGACTEGVSSVEESGMILMPGTTINGSTSLQLFNETASGSPNSNNNATKNIKYTSNSPLTGPIPVNLTIGLPGPISGLDPSCCVINYTVCIKVKVFYEEGNCKSCVFTHCFQFNNQ